MNEESDSLHAIDSPLASVSPTPKCFLPKGVRASRFRCTSEQNLAISGSLLPHGYCCFHEGWRGGFFRYFFRSLIYFCARLTRCPAPQRLNGRTRFPWHLDGLVEGFQPTLSFPLNSDFGLSRPSNSFDLHLLNACVF